MKTNLNFRLLQEFARAHRSLPIDVRCNYRELKEINLPPPKKKWVPLKPFLHPELLKNSQNNKIANTPCLHSSQVGQERWCRLPCPGCVHTPVFCKAKMSDRIEKWSSFSFSAARKGWEVQYASQLLGRGIPEMAHPQSRTGTLTWSMTALPCTCQGEAQGMQCCPFQHHYQFHGCQICTLFFPVYFFTAKLQYY